MGDGHERSEPATPKRRERARREGDHPRATIAPCALAIASAIVPAIFGKSLAATWSAAFAAAAVLAAGAGAGQVEATRAFVVATMSAQWGVVVITWASCVIAAVCSAAASGALGWSPGVIAARSRNRGIGAALRSLVSADSAMQTAGSALAAAAVVVAALPAVSAIVVHVGSSWQSTIAMLSRSLYGLWWRSTAALCAVAIADVAIARRRHAARLRMTPREVRDERAEHEGRPEIKARRRGIATRRARRIRLEALRRASAIIANPTHVAVALLYDPPGIDVPVVVASVAGAAAAFVRVVAAYHEIPVIESPDLARALFARVDVDEPVPEEFYAAIAAIFAWLLRARGRLGGDPDR